MQSDEIWWNGLSEKAKYELIEKIVRNGMPKVREWVESLAEAMDRGHTLTDREISILRKWE